jgi:phage gpG-like protein
MPLEINLTVFGEKAISRSLLRVAERAVDAAPAFKEIAVMFYASEKSQFESEGAWASHGWVPDKQATIDEKIRNGHSNLTLQRTGAMMNSLTTPGAEFSHEKIGPDFVEISSDIPYGKYHQTGTTNMPMRKPVELNEKTKNAMVKVLQAWVIGGIDKKGEVVL